MNNQILVDHKENGKGLVITTSQTEDGNTRIFIVWQNVEQAGALAGWYMLVESDFIKGGNK